MKAIHATCVKYGKDGDFVNYVNGANIGGFIKVADAMVDQGIAQTTSKRIYAALYCALFCLIFNLK